MKYGYFNGTSRKFQCTDAVLLSTIGGTNTFTFSAWVTGTTAAAINALGIVLSTCWDVVGGNFVYKSRTNSNVGTYGAVTTDWVHLLMTFSGTETKFYYNGAHANTIIESTSISPTNFTTLRTDTNSGLMGTDLVYVYNRVLNTDEIAQLYNGGAGI